MIVTGGADSSVCLCDVRQTGGGTACIQMRFVVNAHPLHVLHKISLSIARPSHVSINIKEYALNNLFDINP